MNNINAKNNDLDNTGDGVPMSAEEQALYHELLNLSYPGPKRSIKEAVMAEIKAQARVKRMNRMIRYGSIAACFVLIMGAVIGIIPMINGAQKSAEAEDASYYYAATAGKKDLASPAEEAYGSLEMTGIGSEAASDDSTPADYEMEFSTESAVVYSATLESPDSLLADSAAITLSCDMHTAEMHIFPAILIELAGEEAFNEWYNSPDALDTCGMPSVRNFVRRFAIPESKLDSIAKASGIPYDPKEIYEWE